MEKIEWREPLQSFQNRKNKTNRFYSQKVIRAFCWFLPFVLALLIVRTSPESRSVFWLMNLLFTAVSFSAASAFLGFGSPILAMLFDAPAKYEISEKRIRGVFRGATWTALWSDVESWEFHSDLDSSHLQTLRFHLFTPRYKSLHLDLSFDPDDLSPQTLEQFIEQYWPPTTPARIRPTGSG